MKVVNVENPMKPIFLDTETTHLGPDARMIQLAYKSAVDGAEVNEYFKAPVPIDFGAMAIHHVTNEMVADKPAFEGSSFKQTLIDLLKDNILVAHNADFDMMVLKNEGVETPQYIDTLRVARHIIDAPQHKLQYLRYMLGLNVEGMAHDAWGDIVVLEALYRKMEKMVQEKFSVSTEPEIIEKMVYLTKLPVLMDEFKFGKYKGKPFKEVAAIDQGYLQWLHDSETSKPAEEQNEDLVYTLKNYLN